MPRHQLVIYEDDTASPQPVVDVYDVIWKRVSNEEEEQTGGPGEPEGGGVFTVQRTPPPAFNPTASAPATSCLSMVVHFSWDNWSAEFTCDYDQIGASYNHFGLVEGSMSETFETAVLSANGFSGGPSLGEEHNGLWRLDVPTMLWGSDPCFLELWAKKRVDGVETTATEEDSRRLRLGRYAAGCGEEDGEDDEEQQDGSSEDEEGEEDGEDDAGERAKSWARRRTARQRARKWNV